MAVKLVMTQGGQSMSLEVPDGQYVIGRDPSAGIVIPDPSISSRHAEIFVNDSLVQIRDLGSANGTWVNGFRLQGSGQRLVSEDDKLRIGSCDMAIELVGAAAGQAPVFVAQVVNEPTDSREEEGVLPSFMTFRGRIGRAEFWAATLLLALPQSYLKMIAGRAGELSPPKLLAGLFLWSIIQWFGLCVFAKRWHDRGKSAWWIMLPVGPGAVAASLILLFGLKSPGAVFALALTVVTSVWTLVELGFLQGTAGRNRYGN